MPGILIGILLFETTAKLAGGISDRGTRIPCLAGVHCLTMRKAGQPLCWLRLRTITLPSGYNRQSQSQQTF